MSAGALGNSTSSASVPSGALLVDSKEIWSRRRDERWTLRSIAADLLGRESRVSACGVVPVEGRHVVVRRRPDGGCYYGNVGMCGSVWVCAVCAAKIALKRSSELKAGIESWLGRGGYLTMLTLTVRHHSGQGLVGLLASMRSAQRRFYSGRGWSGLKGRYGIAGTVRNLEVTWGYESGWHPHSHVLVFSTVPLESEVFYEQWRKACEREGLETTWSAWKGGVTSSGVTVGDYVAKMFSGAGGWSVAEEMSYAHYKRGSGHRFTPLDLLRGVFAGGEVELAERFREYAAAYHGLRHLYWSKGLKAVLALGVEVTDEALANEEGQGDEVVIVLDNLAWSWVVREGLRLHLLHSIEEGGEGVAGEYVEWLYRVSRAVVEREGS